MDANTLANPEGTGKLGLPQPARVPKGETVQLEDDLGPPVIFPRLFAFIRGFVLNRSRYLVPRFDQASSTRFSVSSQPSSF
jgi:hypothetical protein